VRNRIASIALCVLLVHARLASQQAR